MAERSVYSIVVRYAGDEEEYDLRRNMTLTDSMAYLGSLLRSAPYEPVIVTVLRKIPN